MAALVKYLGLDSIFQGATPSRPFWEYFHERYVVQDPTAPGLPFFEGSFNEAADEAKRRFKFLLVYLHSEQHDNTAPFCRVTFQRPAVLHLLLDHFVLWGQNVLDSEGYYYSQTLQACGFPFLGVIATIDGQKQLVMRLEGAMPEDFLITKLHECVENVGPSLIAARVEAETRAANERLRQEQDRAFEETQERDRLRLLERRRQEEEQRRQQQREQEECQRRLAEEQSATARIAAEREAKRRLVCEEPPQGADVATLRITMFDGSHVTRRFPRDAPLQDVHDYITAQPGWAGQRFRLTTHPARQLHLDRTLLEEGLFPRAVVIAKEELE